MIQKDLLRFSIIGSVDDGKSTLLGRLLFDTKSILADQMEAIEASSKSRGEAFINLALLTDGLKAEREQGITIDVAYRYFATQKRKFIVADCPGHIQYTRNMVTGTSNTQASVILVDAREGLGEQTKRHTFIASLLGIKHLIVCINKMDLVDHSEERFLEVEQEIKGYLSKLEIHDVHFVPISALHGDNLVTKSQKMDWYQGATLLYILENIHMSSDFNHIDCRFPVQRVIRPMDDNWHDFRGYAGRVESGVFKPGDEVLLLPSLQETKIKEILQMDKKLDEAFYPQSVVMTIEDDIDLSRGDMIVRKNNRPQETKELELMICWLNEAPLNSSKKFILKHTTNEVRCKVTEIRYVVDIHTLHRKEGETEVKINDISRITVKSNKNLFVDKFRNNPNTGSVIIIDEHTGATVAAGMVI